MSLDSYSLKYAHFRYFQMAFIVQKSIWALIFRNSSSLRFLLYFHLGSVGVPGLLLLFIIAEQREFTQFIFKRELIESLLNDKERKILLQWELCTPYSRVKNVYISINTYACIIRQIRSWHSNTFVHNLFICVEYP